MQSVQILLHRVTMLVVYTDFSFFSFKQEDIVKLQILNLGAKLFITNPKQVRDITYS